MQQTIETKTVNMQ